MSHCRSAVRSVWNGSEYVAKLHRICENHHISGDGNSADRRDNSSGRIEWLMVGGKIEVLLPAWLRGESLLKRLLKSEGRFCWRVGDF